MFRFLLALCAARALSASVLYTVTQMGGLGVQPLGISQNGTVAGGPVSGSSAWIYNGAFQSIGRVGTSSTYALAVNDSGVAAGYYQGTPQGAAFYNGSAWVDLHPALGNPSSSQARDINNAGQITGFAGSQGFLREADGTITLIGGLTNGWSINSAGQIAGRSSGDRAVVRETDGTITDLGLPGTFGQAYSISDAGHVVGIYVAGGVGNGFLYTPGTGFTTITGLGGQSVDARGVNSSGVAAGQSNFRAVVIIGGVAQDLNALIDPALGIARLSTAYDINDAGQIVALGTYEAFPSANIYAFLLTPVSETPEPAASALMGAGLMALAWLRRRGV